MAAPRKSWRQKLEDSKDLPQVVDIPANRQRQLGSGRLRAEGVELTSPHKTCRPAAGSGSRPPTAPNRRTVSPS